MQAEFELIGKIRAVETIAVGHGIRILERLKSRVRERQLAKTQGLCGVRFPDGTLAEAEMHWSEVHGIGKRRMKIKRLIE